MNKKYKSKSNIQHFSLENNVNFNAAEKVVKKALILIEGTQFDSKKRKHEFSAERLEKIADNTNALIDSGSRLPLCLNHDKRTETTVGDIEGNVYVDNIREDNLPNPKMKDLIGKLGLFANEVVIKSKKTIEQFKEGLISTISGGLDVSDDTLREVSIVPCSAIRGAALFRSHNFSDAQPLTFDDIEQQDSEIEEVKTQYIELTENLWELTQNILMCDPDELDGNDPNQLIQQAISDFCDRYMSLVGMGQEDEMNEQDNDPRLMQNQGANPNYGGGGQYIQTKPNAQGKFNFSYPVAAFSMAEMEKISEFGIGESIKRLGEGVVKDLGKTGKSFKSGYQSGIKRGSMSLKTKTPTLVTKAKSIGKGLRQGVKRLNKTNTGRVAGLGIGVGAGTVAGLNIRKRMKNNNNN